MWRIASGALLVAFSADGDVVPLVRADRFTSDHFNSLGDKSLGSDVVWADGGTSGPKWLLLSVSLAVVVVIVRIKESGFGQVNSAGQLVNQTALTCFIVVRLASAGIFLAAGLCALANVLFIVRHCDWAALAPE